MHIIAIQWVNLNICYGTHSYSILGYHFRFESENSIVVNCGKHK